MFFCLGTEGSKGSLFRRVKVVDGGRETFLSPDYLKFILDYTGLYQPSGTQSSTDSDNDNICMGRNRLVTEEA